MVPIRKIVATFLLANLVLTAALFTMITVRKVRRDRREQRLRELRGELRAALRAGGDQLDRLARKVRHQPALGVHLATVLGEAETNGDDWPIAAMRGIPGRSELDAVLIRRLRSRRAVVRGTAALLLGHLRTPDAVVHLRPLLADRDGDVKLVTAGALARIGTGQAADALITALGARTMPDERLIERLGAPWAAPVVLSRLHAAADDDVHLRRGLARALGLAGSRSAEAALLDMLTDTDVEIRVSAARALGTCGGPSSTVPLVAALQDEAWEVRAQAATALGSLGAADAVPALEASLGHRAWWVRANAATALAALGLPGHAALHRAVAGDDTYAAERAVEALATTTELVQEGTQVAA